MQGLERKGRWRGSGREHLSAGPLHSSFEVLSPREHIGVTLLLDDFKKAPSNSIYAALILLGVLHTTWLCSTHAAA